MDKETQIRTIAIAVIRRVMLETTEGRSGGSLVASVDAAYPFGPRQGLAYEIWSDEARTALGQALGKGAAA